MALERARGWCAVGYLEGMPDYWLQYLDDTHIPIAAIIHDRDVFTEADEKKDSEHKAGTPKKVHVHINLYFDGKKSVQQVRAILEPIGVKLIQPMHSSQGATRYLLHLDHPERAQYEEDDVFCFGGVALDFSKVIPQSRMNEIMKEMACFIRENDVTEFSEFWFYCCDNEPEWFQVLNNSKAYVISKVLNSNRHKAQEHNRKRDEQRAREVEDGKFPDEA